MASSSSTAGTQTTHKLPSSPGRIRIVVSAAICELCQHLVNDILNDDIVNNPRWSHQKGGDEEAGERVNVWASNHHKHSQALVYSSRVCWLCQLIVLQAADLFPLSYSMKTELFSKAFGVGLPLSSQSDLLNSTEDFTFSEPWNVHLLDSRLPLFHYPSYDPNESGPITPITDMSWLGKSVSGCADSPICYALADRWMHDCFGNHPKCQVQGQPQLPTRVLDISRRRSPPFLYVSDGRTAPYITLSHCWGGMIESRCISANLSAYQNGVWFSSLPKTFRDAIAVARSLGYQYIWIDALCIVQDDHEDWAREAARMGGYYQNSALTIAAGDAKHSDDGFLKPRDPEACHGATIGQYAFPDGSSRRLTVRPYNDLPLTGYELEIRGWTLQERVLSPRILHFTDRGMTWECRAVSWHEKGGSTAPQEIYQTLSSQRPYSQLELAFSWQYVIESYTTRNLTQESDKLPAISGLAAMYGKAHGGVYLAGLWYHEMPNCLLWNVGRSENHLHLPAPYRAPSWSWAAVSDCQIGFKVRDFEELGFLKPFHAFNIQEAKVQEDSLGSFGQVSGGHIIALSVLFPARYFHTAQFPRSSRSGCLETVLPGLSPNEFKSCEMDSSFSERDCWAVPIVTGKADIDEDIKIFTKLQDYLYEGAENDEASEKAILSNTSTLGSGFEPDLDQTAAEDKKSEGGEISENIKGAWDDENIGDNEEVVSNVCRIYMLVLEETTKLPGSTQNISTDSDGIRTFKRVGLAYWKISLLQLAYIESHEVECIKIV